MLCRCIYLSVLNAEVSPKSSMCSKNLACVDEESKYLACVDEESGVF